MSAPLPIYQIEKDLLDALRKCPRLIVTAPTGSGKSTQVPQMLLDADARVLGSGQVVILQPRRLAARLLARRVAWERQAELGQEVGYQVRFENRAGPQTRIRFVTEGVLLRQMLAGPSLDGVSTLIFDEFHERHLDGEVTLARALQLQETQRPDLKIIVMSATLDVNRLEAYLAPCRTLIAEGRTFPVELQYAEAPSYVDPRPVWERAAERFADFIAGGGQGDVLVFMPGSFEIGQTIQAIRRLPEGRGFMVLPLHGELEAADQDAAVNPQPQRKVVVATNVAETSLTIPGVRCVIDSGLARLARYDPYRGINTLLIEKISRASAEQRAGRAGRTAPGHCYRLWSEEEQAHRPAQELPEIKRLDLAEVVLNLKAAGVSDLTRFRWLEPPEAKALADAQQLLVELGALEASGQGAEAGDRKTVITAVGRSMLAFPLHPRYARMLLAAQAYGCVYQACVIAALIQGRDLLLRQVDAEILRRRDDVLGHKESSDFWLLMEAWDYAVRCQFDLEACRRLGIHSGTARQVQPLLRQFLEIARREGLDVNRREVAESALQKCLLTAFNDRLARRVDAASRRYELAGGRRGTLARESIVPSNALIVAAEIREVEGRDKHVQTMLSLATAIDESWLGELFPDQVSRLPRVYYDAVAKRVYAEEQIAFRNLPIGSRRVEPPPAEAAAKLLAEEVLAGRLPLSAWDESIEQWILRVNLLSRHCPELKLAPIGEPERRALVEQICHGEFTYKAIKDKPVRELVRDWLSAPQQQLVEKHAPERLSLGNGRTPRVIYEATGPHIAVRIQELYDVQATPRIAMGRVPVLVHILAPSRRPVQITQDLAGFWREHYPRIKRELQRKYPKHEWR